MADQFQGIQVTGTGKVSVTPDIACILLGVVSEDKKAAEAVKRNNQKMAEVYKVLEAAGIDPKDLQTNNFTIQPQWKTTKTTTTLIGYAVSNIVQIKIRNFGTFGQILDAALSTGANRVENTSFSMQKSPQKQKRRP